MQRHVGRLIRTQVLLAYELMPESDNGHGLSRLKEIMRLNGYYDYLIGVKGKHAKVILPCNMLWKANINPKDARAELRAAAELCGVTIKRSLASEIIGWSATSRRNSIPD